MNSEIKQQQIDWRRARVLELSSQGYSEREIAEKLQPIAPVTVHRDLVYLRQQAQENLHHHSHEVVPEEYQKGMIGMKRILKRVIEIGEAVSDPKIKLEAKRIAIDCYCFVLDMSTNAGIISDAMKYVTQKQEQLQNIEEIKLIDKQIEAIEEERTTEGVF